MSYISDSCVVIARVGIAAMEVCRTSGEEGGRAPTLLYRLHLGHTDLPAFNKLAATVPAVAVK